MPAIFVILLQILPVLFLLALGYFVGSWRERAHFQSLDRRERELSYIRVTNLRTVSQPETVAQATLVLGEAVIATDYFKGFIAGIRKFIGGRIAAYESLMVRARREALIRLLEQARAMGASEVWNVHYQSCDILSSANNRSPATSAEILASGTAIVRRTM